MSPRIVAVWIMFVSICGTILAPTNTSMAQEPLPENYDPDFFFDGFTETCNLSNHCWYDMVIGQTTEAQFLEFLSLLETDEVHIERENPQSVYNRLGYDIWVVHHNFFFDETRRFAGPDYLTVFGLIEDETLQGIVIFFLNLIALDISPQRVLDQLGVPEDIEWVSSYSPGNSQFGIIYENIYVEFDIPHNLGNPLDSEACLDPTDWIDQTAVHRIIFFDPQDRLLLNDILAIRPHALERVSIESAVGLSIDEFVDLILNEERPCLEVNEAAIVGWR